MYSNKTTKRVTAMLLVALLLMTIGFATAQQQLNITGTSKIDSRWDVRITGITSTPTGKAENAETPSFTNTTASFKVNLTDPGDTMVYDITVQNIGTMDAVLSNINKTDSNNPAISFTYSGIDNNSMLKVGESAILKVTVKYTDATLDQANLSSELTLTMNYRQNNPNNDDYVLPSSDYVVETAQASSTSGLVEDPYEEGKYVYRGITPENYITFNNEEGGWRILSVESDGTIKIIRNTKLDTDMTWDEPGTRDKTTSTYCKDATSYGCNAWASTEHLGLLADANYVQYEPNGNKISDTRKEEGTVTQDSSLNTYLNTTYYNSLTDIAKGQIVSHDFYVSSPGGWDANNLRYDNEGIATDSEQIKDYVWNGKIALINAIEYMKGITNPACSNLNNATGDISNCGTNNWLKTTGDQWTLSPTVGGGGNNSVWIVNGNGCLISVSAFRSLGVRPTLYLSSDITLEGTGTVDDPYIIVS